MRPILEVEDLNVRLGGRLILSHLTFSIERGAFVAVVGPNGSGKTTLMRAILGLVPSGGKIMFAGKPIQDFRLRIGYVPQRFDFDPSVPLTVREFIKIPFPKVTERKIRRVLLEVDMGDSHHREVGQLSGGELQRILIARALVADPELVLFDEATSGIDQGGLKSFYDIILHLREIHGTTVLLVSHEISMVYRLASRIICLNRELICYGRPEEAVTKEILERLYGKDTRFQGHVH